MGAECYRYDFPKKKTHKNGNIKNKMALTQQQQLQQQFMAQLIHGKICFVCARVFVYAND